MYVLQYDCQNNILTFKTLFSFGRPEKYEFLWIKLVLGTSCLGYELPWVRVALGMSCSGHELSWSQVILGSSGLGYEYSCVQVVLDTNCIGFELSWGTSCPWSKLWTTRSQDDSYPTQLVCRGDMEVMISWTFSALLLFYSKIAKCHEYVWDFESPSL